MARSFIDTYGTVSFPMLWDPTFESWIELGVNGQPAGMLATADGTLVAQWSGRIPEDDVLQAVAGL
jgi:hypothetical protein